METRKYNTYWDYLKYLCDLKQTNMKDVCNELDLNYESVRSAKNRRRLGIEVSIQIIDHLNGNLDTLFRLPYK